MRIIPLRTNQSILQHMCKSFSSSTLIAKSHPRPKYFEILPENKHFMADIISEDSPYIFMNQR